MRNRNIQRRLKKNAIEKHLSICNKIGIIDPIACKAEFLAYIKCPIF